MPDILGIAITAAISAGMSALTGMVVRLSIERKFLAASAEASEQRRKRVRFTELRCAWMWAAGRVLYHLVRIAQGKRQANGDLEDSYGRLEAVESELKAMERAYAAEAQE